MTYLTDSELDDIGALNDMAGTGPQQRLMGRLVEAARERNRLERRLRESLWALLERLDRELDGYPVARETETLAPEGGL